MPRKQNTARRKTGDNTPPKRARAKTGARKKAVAKRKKDQTDLTDQSNQSDLSRSDKRFPAPPRHLKAEGKRRWEIGRQLWAEGLLTPRDLPAWELLCEAWDEKAKCERILDKDGEYQMCVNGCFAQHPALKRRQDAERMIYKFSQMYGLLPQARTKAPPAHSQSVATRDRK